jgi:hypothetical protein
MREGKKKGEMQDERRGNWGRRGTKEREEG